MAKREHDLFVEPRVHFDARMAVVIDAYELFVECNYEEPASKWRDLRVLLSYNHSHMGDEVVFPRNFRTPSAVLRLSCIKSAPGLSV